MSWHVPPNALGDYVTGRIAEADAWSVEAHLTACERCRDTLAGTASTDAGVAETVSDAWSTLASQLQPQGRVRPAGRWRELTVLLAAGPAARLAWLAAVVVVLGLAAVLDAVPAGNAPWLALVAPLLPILGVAASYGSGLDDAHEVIASTPGGGLRLLLVRSAAVLAVTTPVALAAGIVADRGSPVPWLLASFALTVVTLALGSATGVPRAAAAVGAAWVVAVGATAAARTEAAPVLVTPDAVPAWAAVTVAAAFVIAARRGSYNVLPLPARSRTGA